MQIVFLGTSSGVPTKHRNVSSVALRLPQRAEVWLFDCGEGTQHQLQHTDIRISQISRIFVTHMHGDHTFGLMGLLATLHLSGNVPRMELYGPPQLEEYIRTCSKLSGTTFTYPLHIHAVQPGKIFSDEEFEVHALPLKHRTTTYGYRIVEKDKPGQFNVEKAKELGIPFGPLYGILKNGGTVTLDDGRVINGTELCGEPEKGRRVVYCTDTTYCQSAIDLARDADLLIHESTFAEEDLDLAKQSMHSTAAMAATVAREANVKRLMITHFSPRYFLGNGKDQKQLLVQARNVFPRTDAAYDFLAVDVPRNR